MTSSGPSRSYSERYCQEFELAPKEFVTHVVRRSLHAPIRWVWPLAKIAKRYFEPDLACVSAIENFRTKRELHEELVEFSLAEDEAEFGYQKITRESNVTEVSKVQNVKYKEQESVDL